MNHILQATAWTLIHFCWQASAIAALYAIASGMTARRTSQVRYLVAISALITMLVVAGLTFAWQVLPGSEPQTLRFSAADLGGEFPRIAQPGIAHSSSAVVVSRTIVDRMPSYMLWIDAFWIIGVCVLAVRNLGGWVFIQRLRKQVWTSTIPADLQSRFRNIASALGLRKQVLLRVSESIAGPVTVGAFRTIVLLPASAVTGLGPDELEAVLAHELAHVRRADFLWNLVQTFLETLFFFHPAVWWISGRVRHERELCCDDLALEVCPNPVVLATALFHLEEQRSRQMHLAMAFDGHQARQTLRMRIARILGEPSAFSARSERPFSFAAVLAGAVVLLLSAPQVIASLRPIQVAPTMSAIGHAIATATNPALSTTGLPRTSVRPNMQATAAQKPAPEKKQSQPQAQEPRNSAGATTHETYIDRMKAAGYDVDLDKYIAMKIQDVTPEYARAMSQIGLGKPTADDLVACKIHGVSPEVVSQLKQQGLDVKSFQDAISYRIFEVTPDFVAGMKSAGFANLTSKQLVSLRVQGVTVEYARSIAQQFPGATADDLIQTRIFKIDPEFIASAKRHGFNDLSLKKLVQLRISGVLDEDEK